MSEITLMGLESDCKRLNDIVWEPRMFTCDLCGERLKGDDRVLVSALMMALIVPEEDLIRDRRIRDWPDLPLRRRRICHECYNPTRHVRFFGLDGEHWQIAMVLPEGARRGYCKGCMDHRTLWDGTYCSASEKEKETAQPGVLDVASPSSVSRREG